MKNVIKTATAAIILSATFAAPAFAAVSHAELDQNVRSTLSSGSNVTVNLNDGVVTLTGTFADAGDRVLAIQAAEDTDGVEEVINLAFPAS